METFLCFGRPLFIATPLLISIVKDIKSFISQIESNRTRHEQYEAMLVPINDNINPKNHINPGNESQDKDAVQIQI